MVLLQRLSLAITLIAMLMPVGCSLRSFRLVSREYSPLPQDLSSPLSESDMNLILHDRAPAITTLWSRMKVDIRGKTVDGKQHFLATFLYEPPDKARLRGYRTGLPTLFEILADGNALYFHLNRERELYLGTADEWSGSPVIFSHIDLRDTGYLLQPMQIFRSALEGGEWEIISEKGGHYVILVSRHPEITRFPGTITLIVRKTDLLVREMEISYPGRGVGAKVEYNYYGLFNTRFVLPTDVVIKLQRHDTLITLRDVEYEINDPFNPKVFEPPIYGGMKQLPLRALWEEGQKTVTQ